MISNQAGLGLGDKVHQEEINEYPEELKQEYLKLSEWVRASARLYGRSLTIRVIDPQSFVGMWRVIRYRVRSYPTFILAGEEKFTGWDSEARLHERIRARLSSPGLHDGSISTEGLPGGVK